MIKKFLIGTFALALMLSASVALASYDFGSTTLRVGSRGDYVKTLQTLVGATPVDGVFGSMTAAKVKVWQAADGLVADGVFGPASMAKANLGLGGTVGTLPAGCTAGALFSATTGASCAGVVTTLPAGCTAGALFSATTGASCTGGTTVTPTGPLMGGAGDAEMTHYSTSEKSSFGEGEEDVKVLGFKVEAIDSDISVTNVKVKFTETESSASYKLSNYVDSVDIYSGSTKVGSADASDFTRTSDTPNYYSKSISLSGAVVRDGDKDAFYVVVNATDSIDTEDEAGVLVAEVTSFRFQDATGVVSTIDLDTFDTLDSGDLTNMVGVSVVYNELDIDIAGADDGASLKASSSNPTDVTITVDETDTTDDVLALAFKLDADDDSSDITLTSLPVTLTFADNGLTADTFADSVVESVMVKIGSDEFTAELDSGTVSIVDGAGTAVSL
ncbi:MAG: peptidoglycan-binding protein [Erysipelotrichaceae bacterium]|nr:peptidoglycan-binding protein [Erysipelotrichaceae bacterium]